ncbi:hypothetical protein GCK72_019761 [Caenorhabditis remanei]|uniref:F-box domain-containing protein n=1 Tax=Caenorhabditis remanei TaxID=31234 RepID=A0A6A5GET9_CAERE|nr:hypothetical protein GCK72_019761 [Caenorhabditis remanei]KAF1753205.1 hypothetical protein GCK72_019761 [Caenorhabditis remanei]
MTLPVSLIDMPDLVLNNIFSNSDPRSILVLRKVCRDLRNYIDDVKPDLQIKCIEISIGLTRQRAREVSLILMASKSSHHIFYRKYRNGTMVVCGKKKKVLEDADYFNVFYEELDFLLSRQKSLLNSFRLNLTEYDSEFSKLLKRTLKNKNEFQELEVEYFQIKADKHQVFEILSNISPKSLSRIELHLAKPTEIETEQLEFMDRFHDTKELYMENIIILGRVECFIHLSRAEITVYRVTVEELFLLKEAFLENRHFKHFLLHYRHFVDDGISYLRRIILENRRLRETFGPPSTTNNKSKEMEWYFKIPFTDDALYFFFSYQRSRFARVPLSVVPNVAV